MDGGGLTAGRGGGQMRLGEGRVMGGWELGGYGLKDGCLASEVSQIFVKSTPSRIDFFYFFKNVFVNSVIIFNYTLTHIRCRPKYPTPKYVLKTSIRCLPMGDDQFFDLSQLIPTLTTADRPF